MYVIDIGMVKWVGDGRLGRGKLQSNGFPMDIEYISQHVSYAILANDREDMTYVRSDSFYFAVDQDDQVVD